MPTSLNKLESKAPTTDTSVSFGAERKNKPNIILK